jgi:surfactin synthase thioesterase subunit
VTPEESLSRKEHAGGGFELESFPGGHFYLTAHVPEVAHLVSERLKETC